MLINELPKEDLEKSGAALNVTPASDSTEKSPVEFSSLPPPSHIPVPTALQRWNTKIEALAGLEARGIVRVLPEERQERSNFGYIQMAIIWFSANVSANNLAVGLLGPLVFELGFVDSAMMATFGSFLGAVPTAYMSIWGTQSGHRTMVWFHPFWFSAFQKSSIADGRRLLLDTSWDTGPLRSPVFSTW